MSKRMVGYVAHVVRGKRLKVELGRVIWKNVIVPRLMYGLAAVKVTAKQVSELDRDQRKIYRILLGMPRATAVEFLEEQVGSSSFKDRIGKARIRLMKKVWDRNERLRGSVMDRWYKNSRVVEELRVELRRFGIEDIEFEEWGWKGIEKVIREERKRVIDSEVNTKSSLRWYREVRKRNIGRKWDGGVEEEVVWRYWSGGMKRKMRLDLEMDGRCVWCGEEFGADHVEEVCWSLDDWRRSWLEREGSLERVMVCREAVWDLERAREVRGVK